MKKIVILALILVVIVIYIIIKCIPNEEDRVKQDLKAFTRAVEQEDKQKMLLYIDDAYSDNHSIEYQQFISNIDNLFDVAESIRIQITGLRVIIDSTNAQNVFFASCSLGLKVFALYQGDRALVFGGLVKPNPVRALFKKAGEHYRVYYAEY
jgi:hypothetical protein